MLPIEYFMILILMVVGVLIADLSERLVGYLYGKYKKPIKISGEAIHGERKK